MVTPLCLKHSPGRFLFQQNLKMERQFTTVAVPVLDSSVIASVDSGSTEITNVSAGSFASILACNLGSAGCPVLPVPHHLLSNTLRLRGLSSCCTDHLPHKPSRSWSARSKSRRWRAVFLLRNSRIKLHPQQWNRMNRATRATRF